MKKYSYFKVIHKVIHIIHRYVDNFLQAKCKLERQHKLMMKKLTTSSKIKKLLQKRREEYIMLVKKMRKIGEVYE